MSEIVTADLADIDPSPFRLLASYPYNERKLETLERSIADVGLWEGIIARRHGNRFQIAFGHHRKEAARRRGLEAIPLIVRDLSDEQMLRFMGRENAEEFNADFLVMLEMWEAGMKFIRPRGRGQEDQALDIARLLGWTQARTTRESDQLNHAARGCHAALALISGGHMSRDDLRDLSVQSALDIVERVHGRLDLLDRLGRKGGRPAKEIESSKRDVAGAAKSVAKDVRAGDVRQKDIRGEIDYRAYKGAREKGRQSPLFSGFADEVAKSIHKMLVADKTAEKLREMEQGLPNVELDEDFASLRRVDFALAEHEMVSGKWRTRLTRRGEKVVPFKLLKQGG